MDRQSVLCETTKIVNIIWANFMPHWVKYPSNQDCCLQEYEAMYFGFADICYCLLRRSKKSRFLLQLSIYAYK